MPDTDPLRDPAFPARPQHPDFWRLSECLLESDGEAGEGGRDVSDVMADVADFESVHYMAQQRAARFMSLTDADFTDAALFTRLTAMFFDGFLAGAKFAQRGGHREPV